MVFRFKQFSVMQLRSAMKIGTDGVLLGAWSPLDHRPFSVLDVGSGTGIIALMIAQRSDAQQIDAVEINADAYEECTENFENSPWNDRLFCYHASFQEFADEMKDEERYDLIVSNPPFYTSDYKTENDSKNKARFEDALPFGTLLAGVAALLSEDGIFSVIIPSSEETSFIRLASEYQLFPKAVTHVKGNPETDIKRSLIAFGRKEIPCVYDTLIIETARHRYTDRYKELTKDFYLKM